MIFGEIILIILHGVALLLLLSIKTGVPLPCLTFFLY